MIFQAGFFSVLGRLGPEFQLFWAPNRTRLTAGSCDFMGPKKVSIHGPNRPRNEKNPPEKIMHVADKFIGALIVISKISK